MIAGIVTATFVVAAVAYLVRELRHGGYGRAAVPSLSKTGAERTEMLRALSDRPAEQSLERV